MINKYQEGAVVWTKESPEVKLVIRRYYKRIYHCLVQADPTQKEKVYFEDELTAQFEKK